MLDGFNDKNIISIIPLKLNRGDDFNIVWDNIITKYSENSFNGIIFDLCLDGEGENSLKVKAPPLAQQIRSLASEGSVPHMPIVLCSTKDKKVYFDKDRASHDLFDHYFNKDDNPSIQAPLLKSLSEGYDVLNKQSDSDYISHVLNRDPEDCIDNRFVGYISGVDLSPSDIAHRLMFGIINQSGVLITEDIVASRMGVDVEASGEAWKRLLSDIKTVALYKGVFSSGWTRLWADRVGDFFMSNSDKQPYHLLTARERVDVLVRAGYDGLIPAKPLRFNNSTFFNTECYQSRKPLDALEGIPIGDSMSLMTWQENDFISIYYAQKILEGY